FHNNGDGTFTDVTQKAGLHQEEVRWGSGCCFLDYDRDGHLDLFVAHYIRFDISKVPAPGQTGYCQWKGIPVMCGPRGLPGGMNILYHNNGNGTFTDVTDKAGVAGTESGTFHSGATFFDYDRDGRLDLYVGSYVDMDDKRYCDLGGVQSSCPPSVYRGSPDALYHNNGDGTFTNVTVKAKIYQPEGKNLSVGAADYDNDGWPDLFVANDGLSAYLYQNQHDGTFKEIGLATGIALTGQGRTMAAMCISLGDFNNDGLLDLYISDFQRSSDHIWQNDGNGFFDEVSDQAGITRATHEVLSFGGGFLDYDNDGFIDIFIANGHVYPEVEQATPGIHYKQLNSLFHNERNGKFVEVSQSSGNAFQKPYVGRGVAFADFDNDGFVDVVVANNGDVPSLLHNSGGNGNHFLNFKLTGTKSNRDAIGARIRVLAGGSSQIREIEGGGSYLSQSDLRANFGLGKADRAETVEIRWPSGQQQVFHNVEADKFYQVEEGSDRIGFQKFNPTPPAHR
ncbi:MAG: CRTAC1 family protein, partial [Terriglobales bacterium]